MNKTTANKEWGGDWTGIKLEAFSKYVSAYLTIMNNNSYWKTIYFDGFAGSGDTNKNQKTELYDELFPDDSSGEKIYKGAAERVLTLDKSFDYYYFVDLKESSIEKLKNKVEPFQERHENPFQYKQGDCNKHIVDLSNAMKSKPKEYASLVLLDPFGMQIDWNSIASLKDTRTDIWILVPTGVIVNRLLDKKGELTHIEKLKSFFGLEEKEIREQFYKEKNQQTLFGEETKSEKINKPIEKIAEIYTQRLESIWKHVTQKPLVLRNSRNVPIFHFVFASNNATALKIASQIIGK